MLKMIAESFLPKIEEKLFQLAADSTMRDVDYNSTLQNLKRNLKVLSDRALDVQDEIKSVELSGQKKRKREVENWLEEIKKLKIDISRLEGEVRSEGFISRFFGGDPAAELKERVEKLVEQSKNFGELVLDASKIMGEKLLVPRMVGKAFKEDLKRIWELLRTDNVMRIGIYGMGGVGKTTLIKHINNIVVEKKTQECVFWVTVSQEYRISVLQDKIANVVGVDFSRENDEDKRASRLHEALSSRKNFVLILDDVWENINLEKVGIPHDVESSKVIITTRSFQVCRQIGCQNFIQVKALDTNEAWKLFSDTLGQEATRSPQVEEIAKHMADVCDGLPLGIITLAGSMRGETAIHVWRNALEELWKSGMEHGDMKYNVFKVLKYSFDRLNPKHQEQGEISGGYTELQCCFLYCSLYPEDDMIEREDLVRKFISEELVDKTKTRRAQIDQGHTMLDRLVNVSLLESVDNSHVKMHDQVRAMALRITEGKNMVLAGCLLEQISNEDEYYWKKDVEKMSLMLNEIEEIPDGMSPNCPKLSTLLLQGNESLEFIAESFFSQMHGLCVLDLSDCDCIIELPNSLSDLESLKALLLGGCSELVIVPYLGKLKALKELDLACTGIREVPQGMDELVNLKFLSMDGANALKILPVDLLLKFRNLECLHLPIQIEAPVIEMESMRKLEEFKGRVNDIDDFNRLIGCRSLITYSIIIMPSLEYNEDMGMLGQQLSLENCSGLSKCLLDNFPKFSNLKSLETLVMENCIGIECILAKNGELETHSVAPLRTINEIHLCGLPDFMGIIKKEGITFPTHALAVFSSLRELNIYRCEKMKNLGLTGLKFPNLESIKVEECSEIEEMIEEGGVVSFPKLKRLELLYLPKLKSVGTGLEFPNLESMRVECCSEIEEMIEEGGVVSFPKLKRLDLWNLPKLKHVGTTTICDSIESIEIHGCGALKKLPLLCPVRIDGGESSNVSYSPPPALKTIHLYLSEKRWWETLEWEHPSHKLLLQPLLKVW